MNQVTIEAIETEIKSKKFSLMSVNDEKYIASLKSADEKTIREKLPIIKETLQTEISQLEEDLLFIKMQTPNK